MSPEDPVTSNDLPPPSNVTYEEASLSTIESDRNPGRLPGLSTQLSTSHIFIFKGSKIDVLVYAPFLPLTEPL
ncbi:hypothetical protein GBF38_018594 [Nibea albiflora]|uniref:Uncharacterized protein n=1 Tax=Nibea albiflora TaxID=240163 RepID=A0ACB7EMZ3_NIBAL|nr:hypothetical protein GBF38_018594 [Nibea albiflora]